MRRPRSILSSVEGSITVLLNVRYTDLIDRINVFDFSYWLARLELCKKGREVHATVHGREGFLVFGSPCPIIAWPHSNRLFTLFSEMAQQIMPEIRQPLFSRILSRFREQSWYLNNSGDKNSSDSTLHPTANLFPHWKSTIIYYIEWIAADKCRKRYSDIVGLVTEKCISGRI